ncbi:hypothetical protein HYR69_00540 [Candidatus Sumerlaeota bacterium]|nr:hypothetical protein [Candidatus Sumerlaeota bacterium]
MDMQKLDREGVRFVQFPPDRTFGVLQIRDWGVSGGWQWFHEAQGTIAVPLGKEVRLKVNPDAVFDLTPLLKLELDDIQWLDLSRTPTADDQLRCLANLTLLRRLDLRSTPIGDPGIAHIKDLSAIKELRLNETKITDRALALIAAMPKLENLWLYDTAITDTGLQYLKNISTLEVLQLPKHISHAAQNDLKQVMPHCYVNVQR